MRRLVFAVSVSVAMTAGVGFAQEFTTRPSRVAPQTDPTGPSIEQNSNSSWYKKFVAAHNKLQLISPFRASTIWQRGTSGGGRSSRSQRAGECRSIVLHRILS